MPGSKRSKWINVPLDDDDASGQFPLSPPDSHSRGKGRKGANANHLLNFSVERSVARPSHSTAARRRYPTSTVPFHSQERFLQSHFQFIVTDDFLHEQEADQSAQWDQLTLVICQEQSIDELSKCPICLDPPVAPKITKCGHIFCWPCLLRMFQASMATADSAKSVTVAGQMEIEVPQRFLQCPLCTEMVGLHALKPVKVLVQPVQYKENEQCSFILLRRHRLSMVMRPVEELAGDQPLPDPHHLPNHDEPAATFCRFHLDPHHRAIREQLALELQQLRDSCQNADADEGVFLELAVSQTQAHLTYYEELAAQGVASQSLSRSGKRENDHDREEDFQYVYQEQAGQKLFLHPLCSRALLLEYGTLLHAPLRLHGRIMEMEEITVDLDTRKRYKFLAHLPLSTQVTICEIDMRSLVSRTSLEPLLPKIHRRIHARKKRQQSEQKAEERWRRSQQQEFQVSAPIDVDYSDFVPLSSASGDEAFSFSPPAQVEPPQWNVDRSYRPPPRQLMSRPTQVRRVRGSDGESDEELAAPSFSSSFYESISLDIPPVVASQAQDPEEPQGRKGKKRKQQRKKQLLFSSYN